MSEGKWLGADVTYTGKGTYSYGLHRFEGNKTRSISSKSLADYLRTFPFFAVNDRYEKPEKKAAPPVSSAPERESKPDETNEANDPEEAADPEPVASEEKPAPKTRTKTKKKVRRRG